MKMQKTDMDLSDRRMWFNAMARKFANKAFVATLPPGALEKYQAAANGSKEKFDMLKQFICDEKLHLVRTNVLVLGGCSSFTSSKIICSPHFKAKHGNRSVLREVLNSKVLLVLLSGFLPSLQIPLTCGEAFTWPKGIPQETGRGL